MTLSKYNVLLGLAWLALPLFCAASGLAESRAFFTLPVFDKVTVSPSGERIAALVAVGNTQRLWVRDLESRHSRLVETQARVQNYWWVTEERLLLSIGEPGYAPGLAAINRDGSGFKTLIAPVANATRHEGAHLLHLLPRQPAHVLVSTDARLPHAPDVYRLNVFTGERKRVAQNPGHVFRWMTDRLGRVRLQFAWTPKSQGLLYQLNYRPQGSANWHTLHQSYPGGPRLVPLAFTDKAQELLVASSIARNATAIYRYDLRTGKLGKQVFARAGIDVTHIRLSGAGRVGAVSYQDGMPDQVFLQPGERKHHQLIDSQLPGLQTRVTSNSRNGDVAIVLGYSDRVAGRYFLYREGTYELQFIGARRPALDESALAAMLPVQFMARDGLTLNGYLTLPKMADKEKVPLVVYPHGGPWTRDIWGFDPLVQFFAGHGFAVLQVNFRGSTGYGRRLLNAGREEWGGAMLQDLLDGVKWTVARYPVDKNRICIVGSSFGGYAALMSAARYPATYDCAVSFAAVTNLAAQIRRFNVEGDGRAYHEWRAMVGAPDKDAARLVAASPMNYARAYQVPLLIAHGVHDTRVDVSQARDFAQGLAAAGKEFEYLEFEQGVHGLTTPANRALFYNRALRFIRNAL